MTAVIELYIDLLDETGSEFSSSMDWFDRVKDDPSKLQLGGEADLAFQKSVAAAARFANTIQKFQSERAPLIGRSTFNKKRAAITEHSIQNFKAMYVRIADAPDIFKGTNSSTLTALAALTDVFRS